MYASQSSRLLPIHYRHGFHSRLADLNKLLRYFLGGYRPNKTVHQILSLHVFAAEVRTYRLQEWYFTDESIATETAISTSPTYATHANHILNIKLQ